MGEAVEASSSWRPRKDTGADLKKVPCQNILAKRPDSVLPLTGALSCICRSAVMATIAQCQLLDQLGMTVGERMMAKTSVIELLDKCSCVSLDREALERVRLDACQVKEPEWKSRIIHASRTVRPPTLCRLRLRRR